MMTIEEAIAHAESRGCGSDACAADHRQLADWLRELMVLRPVEAQLRCSAIAMSDEIPRRIRIDLFTPAEKAIYDAVQAVEVMPPDVRLTRAVILLGYARDMVADYVDGVSPPILPKYQRRVRASDLLDELEADDHCDCDVVHEQSPACVAAHARKAGA